MTTVAPNAILRPVRDNDLFIDSFGHCYIEIITRATRIHQGASQRNHDLKFGML